MIVRLYSNKEEFAPISFHSGLNVVLGEIRLATDRGKDTHNLGKSTLGQVIDFCLLKERRPEFFLFKHEELFQDYTFYLELMLADGRYLTIRRDVANNTKIWLHVTTSRHFDVRELDEDSWTHKRLPIRRAKDLVDGYLAFEALKPEDYRKVLGYLLRGQSDFNDVFRLSSYKGKERDWKPFLLQLLGFNRAPFSELYDLEEKREELRKEEETLEKRLASGPDEPGELDAYIDIKQREIDELQAFLDAFSFETHDHDAVREVVDNLDVRIGQLNDRRYDLLYTISQIERSLEKEALLFSTSEAKKLFEEAGILFQGQIERSFEQLLRFNADISEERRSYLEKDLQRAKAELKDVESQLRDLDAQRSRLLDQLGSKDVISKYKSATNDLVSLRAELETMKARREQIRELQKLRRKRSANRAAISDCDARLREEVDSVSDTSAESLFAELRREYDTIVVRVLNQHALLSVSVNDNSHADFKAEIVGRDGSSTNQDEGKTYRGLLCVAFDLALLLAHDGKGFPTFVYHDDVLSGLDKRKKENLRDVMRGCADRGVQQIVTVIDSDLPYDGFFDEGEIVLRLHDDGDDGRLFKIPEW